MMRRRYASAGVERSKLFDLYENLVERVEKLERDNAKLKADNAALKTELKVLNKWRKWISNRSL